MSPIYAVLAAPLLRPLGVPIVLWFTHWRASGLLRLAERVSNRVVTVARGSFPLPSGKVVPIGHGIDVTQFPCRMRDADATFRVLALGRTSPAKGLEAIAQAVRLVRERGVDAELEVRGPSETGEERAHRAALEELGVRVEEPLPRTRLPEAFARADVLVNNALAGSLDKVVFEACASCVPVLASNPGFAGFLDDDLRFPRNDVEAIAGGLERLAAMPPQERQELGRELRRRVEAGHSTETWAARVIEVLESA
jgi:glycosyltransferase involved in cell wall biosynthesis